MSNSTSSQDSNHNHKMPQEFEEANELMQELRQGLYIRKITVSLMVKCLMFLLVQVKKAHNKPIQTESEPKDD